MYRTRQFFTALTARVSETDLTEADALADSDSDGDTDWLADGLTDADSEAEKVQQQLGSTATAPPTIRTAPP